MLKNKISYSLWLRPTQTQIDGFTKIISRLAHSYRTTPFPPHITLLSSITTDIDSIKQICKNIVDQTQEFDIPLQNIAYTEAYYRNYFILAKPINRLAKLYENTKTELAHKTDEPYVPHLSLLYGNLEIETKKNLSASLDKTYPKHFHCQRLDLYNTSGEIAEWYLIESYFF